MPSSQFVACSFVFHSHDLRLPFEGSGSSVELMSSCVCVYMYAHIHIFFTDFKVIDARRCGISFVAAAGGQMHTDRTKLHTSPSVLELGRVP